MLIAIPHGLFVTRHHVLFRRQCHSFPGTISNKCWMKRSICLLKQISLLEIVSTVVLLAIVVVDLSRVFHVVDSATLQVAHSCTPAPDGMLAVPAALPTGVRGSSCGRRTAQKHIEAGNVAGGGWNAGRFNCFNDGEGLHVHLSKRAMLATLIGVDVQEPLTLLFYLMSWTHSSCMSLSQKMLTRPLPGIIMKILVS